MLGSTGRSLLPSEYCASSASVATAQASPGSQEGGPFANGSKRRICSSVDTGQVSPICWANYVTNPVVGITASLYVSHVNNHQSLCLFIGDTACFMKSVGHIFNCLIKQCMCASAFAQVSTSQLPHSPHAAQPACKHHNLQNGAL